MHFLRSLLFTSLFIFFSPIAQGAKTYIDPRLAEAAHTTIDKILVLKTMAQSEGWQLTSEQELFASDMLMGHYTRQMKPPGTQANLVWLPVQKEWRSQIAPVIRLVGQILDPDRGVEHMRLNDYLKLEPKSLGKKMWSQRKHLLVMDDMAEFHEINFGQPQTLSTSNRLNRANEYDDWLMMATPERLTIFVIDEDGFVLANMHEAFVSLIDFVGDQGDLMTKSCRNVLRN